MENSIQTVELTSKYYKKHLIYSVIGMIISFILMGVGLYMWAITDTSGKPILFLFASCLMLVFSMYAAGVKLLIWWNHG